MSKRDNKRKQERRQKRLEFHLNRNVAKLDEKDRTEQISQSCPINADIPDYDEKLKENFLISFLHYKVGQCGLKNLAEKSAKQLVKKLKAINNTKIGELPVSGLVKDNICNSGDYSKLYKDLSPDVEIKEIDFSDSGRIFAYFVERYVCIVAIDPNHRNTH